MPLTPGTRLGPYEIVISIGAGGMGEVYRARFTREAQILAALNHPNIAAIYGLEEAGGTQFVCSNATSDVTLLREAIP